MLTTTIAKAAAPQLAWSARAPGLAAIVAQALRGKGRDKGYRCPKPQPAPFTWL